MADRSNQRLNEAIENMIRMWDGTIHGQTIRNMYENGSDKDYIQNPKPSGYRSLHLIVQVPIFLQNEKKPVTVEVQFRTIAMDFWASLEHKMRYKKSIPAEQMKYLQDELYDCAEQSAALDKRMQSIRNLIAENKEEEEEPKGFFLPLL